MIEINVRMRLTWRGRWYLRLGRLCMRMGLALIGRAVDTARPE